MLVREERAKKLGSEVDIVIFSLKLLILYVDDNTLGRPTKKRTPTCFFAIFGVDDVIIWGHF